MTASGRMLVALLSAALCFGAATASNRDLLATNIIEDISIPYNAAITGTDPLNQLSMSDPRVLRTVSGLAPEQVDTVKLHALIKPDCCAWCCACCRLCAAKMHNRPARGQTGYSYRPSWLDSITLLQLRCMPYHASNFVCSFAQIGIVIALQYESV